MSIDRRRVTSTALGVLAGTVAAAGTLAVTVAGFTLSYDAIRAVGQAAHMRHSWAWLLPVSVDGAMAVATVAAVVLRRMGRAPWYPWAVVLTGAGVSIACNALHAKMGAALQLDKGDGHEVAMAVSAIPAVMLALSVHLLVVLIDAAARTFGEPDSAPVAVAVTSPPSPVEVPATVADSPAANPWAYSVPAADRQSVTVAAPKRTPARTAKRPAAAAKADTDTARKVAKLADRLADIPKDKLAATIAARIDVHPRTVRRHLAAMATDSEPDSAAVNGVRVPDLVTTAGGTS